jgi:hypothetical protein
MDFRLKLTPSVREFARWCPHCGAVRQCCLRKIYSYDEVVDKTWMCLTCGQEIDEGKQDVQGSDS